MCMRKLLKRVLPKWAVCGVRSVVYEIPFLAESYIEKVQEYNRIINARINLKLTDVDKLAEDIPLEFVNTIPPYNDENWYYGGLKCLLDYIGAMCFIPFDNISIQHGASITDVKDRSKKWYSGKHGKRNLCWGTFEKDVLSYFGIEDATCIGAPFFYAKGILDDQEVKKEKERLGKNLLVFPSHETHFSTVSYDNNELIERLNEQKGNFDTIRICLYWKDILKGEHKFYQEKGFECVCSGHIFDPYFLRRQKSLFGIADCIYCNDFGSHVGYSLFCNKPCFLQQQNISTLDTNPAIPRGVASSLRSTDAYKRITAPFVNNSDYKISKEMFDCLEPYFGFSKIQSKEVLYSLLFS